MKDETEESQLRKDLQKLDKAKLAGFIEGLHGLDKKFDQRIERLLVTSDPSKLAALLKKSISSLNRRRAAVPLYETPELAAEVEQLAQETFKDLLPLSPELCVDLLERLMASGPNSLERCDDSNGYVGNAYRDIVLLWLNAAKLADKPGRHWLKKIKDFLQNDDYALYDLLLINANILLSEESLRELAFYYETALRRSEDRWQRLSSSVRVTALARALGDTELYERGLLFGVNKPNVKLVESLVRFCIEQGDEARAMRWLRGGSEQSSEWLILKIQSYRDLKQGAKLPELCERLMAQEASLEHLKIAIEACPEKSDQWREQALKLLGSLSPVGQIELLLSLQQYKKALHVALDQYYELRQCLYTELTRLLDQVPEDCHMLRVVLYRALLLELLERGHSQAYTQGAGYLKALRALDSRVRSYQPLESHEELEVVLQQRHGRKRNFWALV